MTASKSPKSRRDFIKSGMTGLAGAVLAPAIIKNRNAYFEPQEQKGKFVYRTLGKTGIKLPVVSMGTYNATSVAREGIDAGIVHIDTSADYRQGNDEKMFGELLKDRKRDSFVMGTSIGMWTYRSAEQTKNAITAEKIKDAFNGSLERLQLDFIDIYYLGGVQHKEIMEHEPYLEALRELKRSGKARFMGITTHSNEPEMIRMATDSDVYDVVLTKYNFRQNNKDEVKEAIKYAADKGMGVVAMKTQAGVYWDREKKEMINQKAALKWVLQDENVHTAIPSFKNTEQMYEDMSVMEDLTLTDQELADLKLDKGNSSTALFCSQCEECIPQCPKDLDIPTVMRSYMYAYGYEQPAKARETLSYSGLKGNPCSDCPTCSVKCASGFDVKRKVTDIARLNDVPQEFLI
ncbi:MAG: oxidoreductase [bacterium]|nr:oxidoreductase [bacterium]